jgi:MFS family permease
MHVEAGQKSGGIFYGWWIVVVAAVGMFMGYGAIFNFTFGVFSAATSREFAWSRSAVSLGYALSLVAYAVTSPFIGRLVDRFGARRVIVPSMLLFGLALMSFYFLSSSLWHGYAGYALLGVSGAGSALVPYSKVISEWFDRRRGLALGLAMVGVGLSGFIMPSATQFLIAHVGWREAYVLTGLLVISVAIPVGLFLKETPQMVGQLPDGTIAAAASRRSQYEHGMCGRDALRTRTFWLLFSAVFLVAVSLIGCLVHLVPMLTDRGGSSQAAALAASLLGGAVIPGRVASGYLVDRFFAPYVAVCFFCSAGLGILLFWSGMAGSMMFVAAFLVGLGMGAEGELIAYLVSRYFGLLAFSEIYAYALISFTLGGIIGPLLMGVGFDRTGSYRLVLGAFVLATLMGACLMALLGPYRVWLPAEKLTAASPEDLGKQELNRIQLGPQDIAG